ncbi:PREDICTED: uncharacterized protein LOC106115819 [Papilio xuthus]|uniref:Uncharacterized protein LOC106115819 n=1 Tax=Papilio xuthus TaxID=66420 RepID=A0AAJ7E6E0_PAPXU|nr:PREDICTED: uncharacterized protein LOC106115819 [Papilio xuthus]
MNIRNRTKDVGLALFKLDKLPLQKLRGKSTVGGSKDSSPEDANCKKCKHLIEKSFSIDREHVSRAVADKDEKKDKLETIVEHPLVEAEPRVEGIDAPPKLFGTERFKQPQDRRLQKSFDLSKLTGLDDLACKLMNVPPSQIDSKLLETCLTARVVDFDKSRTYPIVENFDCDVPEHIGQTIDGFCKDDKDTLQIGRYSNLTPLLYRSYDLHLESDSDEKSFKAESSHPLHLDADFKMSIEKDFLMHDLNLHSFPIRHEFIAYNMIVPPPLPPNDTSISSRMAYEEEIQESFRRDRTMPPYMREYKLGKKSQDASTVQDASEESYRNYLSTLSGSATFQESLGPGKVSTGKSTKQEIPLSQLLKQVRQRNKIAQEMAKKKLKFDVSPFFSKSTCFPPLDLRPKSATCPPKACPPRKKETPPRKAMPCPPPKKPPCPPPKKGPCPVKSNPCDPCKPPPPCPAPKNPCGLYTGNKFKDTITLILCGFNPSNILRHTLGLPLLWNFSNNLVKDTRFHSLSTTSIANSKALKLKSSHDLWAKDTSDDYFKVSEILRISDLEKKQRDIESVYFARSYDPWAPIPSWPAVEKKEKKKLVCPKDGCKAPKVLPSKPCKEFPCSFNAADRKR